MSLMIFTGADSLGPVEIRVGYQHLRTGQWSYFGDVWRITELTAPHGDEEAELITAGGFSSPIQTIPDLLDELGEFAEYLPTDLAIPHNQTTEQRYVHLGPERLMRMYALTPTYPRAA